MLKILVYYFAIFFSFVGRLVKEKFQNMCYINGVKVSRLKFIEYKQQQKELKQLQQLLRLRPVRRGFDYNDWPVIKPILDQSNFNWHWKLMEWGYIPSGPSIKTREDVNRFRNGYVDASGKLVPGYTTLNAMGEDIFEKPMYKDAVLQRRCIIVSDGFYEHQHLKVMGAKGQLLKTPEKFPYKISVKGQEHFFFPGIYNTWTDQQTGETVDSFAIITTEAVGIVRQIHNTKNRMPVILTQDLAEEWTNENVPVDRLKKMATFKIEPGLLKAHTVQKDFLEADDPGRPCVFKAVPDLIYDPIRL